MRIVILPGANDVARAAADELEKVLDLHGAPSVGFPTGRTPLPFYAELRRRSRAGTSVGLLRPFGLDEYLGLSSEHPQSFGAFLRRELVEPLDIRPDAGLFLRGDAPDPIAECARFETELRRRGIDLVFLGLGGNGHVAFNEPGSAPDSVTRVVELSGETLTANRGAFPEGQKPPARALTSGIGTLRRAARIVILVTGAGKAGIARRAFREPPLPAVPASLLADHGDLTVLIDTAAAARLG